MVIRSPTYVVPVDYCCHVTSHGAYDGGVEAADIRFLMLLSYVDGQLARGLFAMFARNEPERYMARKAAGIPVLDSSDPSQSLMHNLPERAGGHYVDVGGTKPIVSQRARLGSRLGSSPLCIRRLGCAFLTALPSMLMQLSGALVLPPPNVRETAVQILAGNPQKEKDSTGEARSVLGAQDIAERLEGIWGIDGEGEVRGMWERHQKLDNSCAAPMALAHPGTSNQGGSGWYSTSSLS